MTRRRAGQTGAAMLEFALVGIGLIFILLSLFEVSRGLWAYDTLAYAVREGTRYAATHGEGCASTCSITIGNIISYMEAAGAGFDTNNVTVTFTPQSGTTTSDTMANLASNSTTFPPSTANAPGDTVEIAAKYKFKSVLSMLWFGSAPVSDNRYVYLATSSTQLIQF